MDNYKIEITEKMGANGKIAHTIFSLTRDGETLSSTTYSAGKFDNAKFTPEALMIEAHRFAAACKAEIAMGVYA